MKTFDHNTTITYAHKFKDTHTHTINPHMIKIDHIKFNNVHFCPPQKNNNNNNKQWNETDAGLRGPSVENQELWSKLN